MNIIWILCKTLTHFTYKHDENFCIFIRVNGKCVILQKIVSMEILKIRLYMCGLYLKSIILWNVESLDKRSCCKKKVKIKKICICFYLIFLKLLHIHFSTSVSK